jgi:ABC-type phosphate transport system auxiliary subunit
MKKLISIAVFGLLLAGGYAQAKDDKNMEQTKMTACDKQVEGLKGDEQKMKMKECMNAKHVDEKMHKSGKQQEKMKHCSAEAKGMKGEERKMKMSECLKG